MTPEQWNEFRQWVADVQRDSRLSAQVSLFVVVIADSGERKTTCEGFFMRAIRDYEDAQAEAAQPDISRHRAEQGAWEAKANSVKDRIRQDAKAGKPTTRSVSVSRRPNGNASSPKHSGGPTRRKRVCRLPCRWLIADPAGRKRRVPFAAIRQEVRLAFQAIDAGNITEGVRLLAVHAWHLYCGPHVVSMNCYTIRFRNTTLKTPFISLRILGKHAESKNPVARISRLRRSWLRCGMGSTRNGKAC